MNGSCGDGNTNLFGPLSYLAAWSFTFALQALLDSRPVGLPDRETFQMSYSLTSGPNEVRDLGNSAGLLAQTLRPRHSAAAGIFQMKGHH